MKTEPPPGPALPPVAQTARWVARYWLPFSGGMRRCIGATFAQLEMTVAMKTIAEQVDMEPAEPAAEPVGRRAIVLAPKRGSRVIASTVG
jgi:cytochrome P450